MPGHRTRQAGALVALFMGCCLLATGCATKRPGAAELVAPSPRFNTYILRAVDMLAQDPARAGKGYGNHAFTQPLQFGDQGMLNASKQPLTMCVAAQLEVLVEALNLYAAETGDMKPFRFLPKKSWERLRATDLRGQIWIVEGANSSGAADAFRNHGIGEKTTFEALQPGDFVNFNRANGTGHGVVFLSYIDRRGNDLATFSPDVAGFRYFSSQGNAANGGLGFRHAFFYPFCPESLPAGMQRDCRVIRSKSQRLLNTGYVAMPAHWKRPDPAAFATGGVDPAEEGEFDSTYFTGETPED